MSKFDTLVEIFSESTKRFAQSPLFGEKRDGEWKWLTYGAFKEKVDNLRGGLAGLGVKGGDRVAVISNNRAEWAVGAYATYTLGAAYVPMYESQHDAEWAYILNDCGAEVCFVPSEKIKARLLAVRGDCPALQHVITFTGDESEDDTMATLLRRGAETPGPLVTPDKSALAGLIYTSGTTGKPKGVKLSHGNMAHNVSAMHEMLAIGPGDRSLSFLPWAHSFGQVVELHGLFSMGASLAIAESVEKLLANMAEIGPTLVFSVPRVFNKLYAGLNKKMEAMPPLRRKLLNAAMANAAELRSLQDNGKSSVLVELAHKVFDKVVLSKVRGTFFGPNLKYAFSGGAAISREVAEFIDNIGVTVYEGYGLTETSPIATCNSPKGRRIGSVGKSIPGTRVSIDKEAASDPLHGEVICYGHNVMQGYYNLPEENEKVFTADGGFRTGDMGYVDADGFLYITGRIKEQYKLENGKYVVPVPIEEAMKLSPWVVNVMVHGANRPYNVAIVVPDMEKLKAWAAEKSIPADPLPALLQHPEVLAHFRDEIAKHTQEIKGYERVRNFALVAEDFSIDNDLLTPKMSLKRRNVVQRYETTINGLYEGASPVTAGD
ncbi:MAG: long-chain fatty acid--CoA ligase [Deltaproteobacteria bacterium]|nr:long-chain fatty acid--CoA ligase [Myxococcales bacterium]MDP3216744.1 long-chain fatty acid--CoA ligase [Deltaproteobacteria bacterium]